MSLQKLCLILSLFSLWIHHNYCAMNQIQAIRIDNGLLTIVPKILVAVERAKYFSPEFFHSDIQQKNKDSLANLMAMNYTAVDDYDGKTDHFMPKALFFPTIVKIVDSRLINLGSFCKKVHKEAKEACRQNKAIFYPFKQGLIMYSYYDNQASNFDIFEERKKELEDMVCQNLQKKFVVYASVLYSISVAAQPKEEPIETPTEKNTKDMAEKTDILTNFLKNIGWWQD